MRLIKTLREGEEREKKDSARVLSTSDLASAALTGSSLPHPTVSLCI